jgi:hypothetical protein
MKSSRTPKVILLSTPTPAPSQHSTHLPRRIRRTRIRHRHGRITIKNVPQGVSIQFLPIRAQQVCRHAAASEVELVVVGEEGRVDTGGVVEEFGVLRVGVFHAGVLVGEDGEGVVSVVWVGGG